MPSTLKISKKTSTNSFKQDQELALKPTMVLVLGMHRSGTSVTARLLECLGAKNSDILMKPCEENPEGYFEDQDIYEFNERKLLPRLGRAWHSVGSVDWTALSAADRGKYALEALEIVRKNYFLSNPLSVLKEPRICILLPFWLSVLQHAGFNVKVVCVVRDPVSVVRSLSKAQGLSLTHSGILFVNYWISALNYIQDLPAAFVQYDEIFVNPAKSLRDVAQKLSLPYPKDFEERVHAFSSTFFDKKLRHSTLQSCDLALETDLPPLAIELYESLLAGAQAQNVKKTAKFLEHSRKWLQSVQPAFLEFDRLFAQFHGANNRTNELQTALDSERSSRYRDQLAGLEGEKARLEQELARAQTEAAQQSGQQAAIAGEAEGLRQQLGEVTARAGALQQDIDERSRELATCARLIAERDQALEVIQADWEKEKAAHSEAGQQRETLGLEKQNLESSLRAASEERDQLVTQMQELKGKNESLQQNIDERFRELATCARMIFERDAEIEKAKGYAGDAGFEIAEIQIADSGGEWPHKHLNFDVIGVKISGRDLGNIRARLVQHHGRAGIVIFQSIYKQDTPLRRWEETGKENDIPFILLVPQDALAKSYLVASLGSDFYFIHFLAQSIVSALRKQLKNSESAPSVKQNIQNWLQIGLQFQAALAEIPARIHYDDVLARKVDPETKSSPLQFEIKNATLGRYMIPQIRFQWTPKLWGGELQLSVQGAEPSFLGAWPKDEKGIPTEIFKLKSRKSPWAFNKKKTFLKTNPIIKQMNGEDQKLIIAIIKEMPNLIWHFEKKTN